MYLERRLDKKRILTLYLNHIYLGQDGPASVMGMRAASRYYFGKDTADLTLAEAATLAGMIRGPGLYDPLHDPEACRARRDWVLKRMHEDGFIGGAALGAALSEPLNPSPPASEEDARDDAYYVAEVVRQLLPRYGGDVLYRNGLSIYTAMDPVLQSAAQRTLRGAKHQAALVALDPRDGGVLALAGGRDFGGEPVQPRDAGAAPARLRVQAVRVRGRAEDRPDAGDGPARPAAQLPRARAATGPPRTTTASTSAPRRFARRSRIP